MLAGCQSDPAHPSVEDLSRAEPTDVVTADDVCVPEPGQPVGAGFVDFVSGPLERQTRESLFPDAQSIWIADGGWVVSDRRTITPESVIGFFRDDGSFLQC